MDQNREFVRKLCDLEIPGDIRISPSGEKVVYSTSLTWGHLKGKVPVTTLWLATLGEANSSRKITEGTHRDHSLAWHPLKDEITFVSDRAGNGSKSAIYTMSPTDIGKAVPITPEKNEQAIEKFKFSPDGTMIAFISKDEKTEEERQREERGEDVQVWGQGYRYSRLRVLDLEAGDIRTLSLEQHVLDLCWIDDSREGSKELEIGFVACENTLLEHAHYYGTEIHVVKTDLQQPRKICFLPNRANDLSWGAVSFERYDQLYFWTSARADKDFCGSALYEIDIKEESARYKQVILEDAQNVTAVQSVNGRIVVKAQNRLEDSLLWARANGIVYSCKQEIEAYDLVFGTNDEELKMVVATSDVNNPVEVYSMARDSTIVKLSQHGDCFQRQNFGTFTTISCQTTDDHEIEIDGIYLEPSFKHDNQADSGAPSKPYPTVILVHGGPTTRVTNAFNTLYYMWTPYLLSLGYGVLLPNYRGSSGRGEDFASFSYDGADTQYEDVIALTQCAIKKGYADPDRLVVGGYSHGGLIANLCALRNGNIEHSWRYKAAISGASISDIDTMALTSDMGYAYQAELHHGATPWTRSSEDTSTRGASALWAFSDIMEISQAAQISMIPPILILHGANDERCHVSQAWGMRRALEHHSLPFEMAIYPRQGHIFHEQYFWIDMALRVGRWIERHIGPGQEDVTMT